MLRWQRAMCSSQRTEGWQTLPLVLGKRSEATGVKWAVGSGAGAGGFAGTK